MKFVVAVMLIACGGSSRSQQSPDGGTATPDAPATVEPGTVLDVTPWDRVLFETLDASRDLQITQDGVYHGEVSDTPVAEGLALRGSLDGNFVVGTNDSTFTPSFCRYDVTTGEQDQTFGQFGCAASTEADRASGSLGVVKVPGGYASLIQVDCSNGCTEAERSFGVISIAPDGGVPATITFTTIVPELQAYAFAAQSTGDLVVSAYAGLGDTHLVRIHGDGSLDTSFGTAGEIPDGNGGQVHVLADDSLLVEATFNGVARIDRYTKDGQRVWSADVEALTHATFDDDLEIARADVDASGRTVVAFRKAKVANLLRLTADGEPDASFGASGFVSVSPTSELDGVGFTPDGTILVGLRVNGASMVAHVAP